MWCAWYNSVVVENNLRFVNGHVKVQDVQKFALDAANVPSPEDAGTE